MTNLSRPGLALVLGALASGMLSCSKDPAPAAPQPVGGATPSAAAAMSLERPNLVLITLEATRADHIGCYNDPTAQTPALDQLAREGAIFEQAIATAPLTLPSLASVFTGVYPPGHGVRDNTGFTLDGARTTLAEHLKAEGFATSASVGSRVVAADAGLRQGFDRYAQPERGSRVATAVVDDAIQAVDRMKGGPFFLWVQLDDPNAPYLPPAALHAKFSRRPYDGEIAGVDVQLKRLFDHLQTRGLFETSVVVATAAEGESLGEHGEETHGLLLYDSTLKVPLLVRYPPRVDAGTRVKSLISLVDLAPTLAELIGVPPIPAAQGRSRAAALLGGDAGERGPVYAESIFGERAFGWAPLHALRSSAAKFVDGTTPELYDVRRDPSETINLAAQDPTAAAALRSQLDDLMRAIGAPASEAMTSPSRRDPKSAVAASNLFVRAQLAIENGQADQAAPLLAQVLAKDPGNPAAKALLTTLRGASPAATGAAADTFAGQRSLGTTYYAQGKLAEAASAFRAALAKNPQSAATHYALGNVLVDQGDAAGAESEFRAAVAAEPAMADAWNQLGVVLDKTKRRPEALAAFTRALEASPDHADALFNRGKLELLERQLVDARRDVDRLLAEHDDYAAAHYLEAHLCMAENNPVGAKQALNAFLAAPKIDPRMKASAEDLLRKIGD